MVGQQILCDLIATLNLDCCPRSLIITGDKGAGKHQIVKLLADHLKISVFDITDNLSASKIDEINFSSSPNIYLIDGDNISIKDQNTILKFVEEPLKNAYICILTTNYSALLPTIQNRCTTWRMAKYSKETLESFINKPLSSLEYQILNTPGKLLAGLETLDEGYNLALKIFERLSNASLPNSLTISDKLAFKSEKNKLDLDMFFKLLTVVARDLYINNRLSIKAYNLTIDFYNNRYLPKLDLKYLFENYLINLRNLLKETL